MSDTHHPLVGFARRKTGHGLRSVVRAAPAETELLYVREDLSRQTVRNRLDEIGAAVEGRPRNETAVATFGRVQASIQLREAGTLVILRRGDTTVFLTVEPYASRNLGSFVTQCRRILDGVPANGETSPAPTPE
jgi:hypothetical protein